MEMRRGRRAAGQNETVEGLECLIEGVDFVFKSLDLCIRRCAAARTYPSQGSPNRPPNRRNHFAIAPKVRPSHPYLWCAAAPCPAPHWLHRPRHNRQCDGHAWRGATVGQHSGAVIAGAGIYFIQFHHSPSVPLTAGDIKAQHDQHNGGKLQADTPTHQFLRR